MTRSTLLTEDIETESKILKRQKGSIKLIYEKHILDRLLLL